MRICQTCGHSEAGDDVTCPKCGEASWTIVPDEKKPHDKGSFDVSKSKKVRK